MTLRVLTALCVSVSLGSNGCTFVGGGVGVALDVALPGPYDTRPPTAHVTFKPKDHMMVWLANGERVQGRYLGAFGPTERDPETYLIIDTGSKAKLVAMSEIRSLGVEISGKGWLYGALIGLTIDVALVIVAAIALSNMKMDGLRLGGDSGCFC
ncbi:MAG: hypothetical protein ACOY0T_00810 [Myxococcota bacterium]